MQVLGIASKVVRLSNDINGFNTRACKHRKRRSICKRDEFLILESPINLEARPDNETNTYIHVISYHELWYDMVAFDKKHDIPQQYEIEVPKTLSIQTMLET